MQQLLTRIQNVACSTCCNLGLLILSVVVLKRLYKILGAKSKTQLRGKVVWITGASSGIGEACAKEYFANGAKVIISSRNYQALLKVRDSMVAGKNIDAAFMPQIVVLDLQKSDELQDIVEKAWSIHGVIDILVNNAGISNRGAVIDSNIEVYRQVMEVNYFAPLVLVKALLPKMIQRKEGQIIYISSVQGKMAIPHRSAYTASKHACQGFYDSLRAEVAQHNIKVLVVSPGYVRTNLSINALDSDGSKHGVMDKATDQGMMPENCASLIAQYGINGESDVVLCPTIPKIAIFLRYNFPSIYFLIMRKRAEKLNKT